MTARKHLPCGKELLVELGPKSPELVVDQLQNATAEQLQFVEPPLVADEPSPAVAEPEPPPAVVEPPVADEPPPAVAEPQPPPAVVEPTASC